MTRTRSYATQNKPGGALRSYVRCISYRSKRTSFPALWCQTILHFIWGYRERRHARGIETGATCCIPASKRTVLHARRCLSVHFLSPIPFVPQRLSFCSLLGRLALLSLLCVPLGFGISAIACTASAHPHFEANVVALETLLIGSVGKRIRRHASLHPSSFFPFFYLFLRVHSDQAHILHTVLCTPYIEGYRLLDTAGKTRASV